MQFSGSTMALPEAELTIRELQPLGFCDIGSDKWKNKRDAVEQLNMCTHANAVRQVDDYVKTFLVEHDKLPALLHELLMMEAWRQRVVDPSSAVTSKPTAELLAAIASSPTGPYMYCSYESILVNLLECVCFYEETVTGFGDDILELIDYCWRQVSFLFSMERELSQVQPADDVSSAANALSSNDPVKTLLKSMKQQSVTRAMGCISILWFIVDRLNDLPLAVSNSILNKNDLLVGLSDILVMQPWVRRVGPAGGKGAVAFQKFFNGDFAPVSDSDALVVCVPEAHAWFCMHKLLCDPEVRRRYQYTTHKKEIILKVRRFMNETLIDQIPALSSVQRALEELSFMEPPSGTEEKFKSNNLIIIEQVPRIITAVMSPRCTGGGADWSDRERKRLTAQLSDPSERARDSMRMAKIFDQLFADES